MNIQTLSGKVKKASRKVDDTMRKNNEHIPWWRVPEHKLPDQAMVAVATSLGPVKAGTRMYLISAHKRQTLVNEELTYIYEWVGLTAEGAQPLVQLGRDVDLVV